MIRNRFGIWGPFCTTDLKKPPPLSGKRHWSALSGSPDAPTHPTGIRMHLCIHLESECTYASAWTSSIAYMFCFSEKGIFNRRSRNPLKRIVSRSFFLQIIMFFISSFSLWCPRGRLWSTGVLRTVSIIHDPLNLRIRTAYKAWQAFFTTEIAVWVTFYTVQDTIFLNRIYLVKCVLFAVSVPFNLWTPMDWIRTNNNCVPYE